MFFLIFKAPRAQCPFWNSLQRGIELIVSPRINAEIKLLHLKCVKISIAK